MQILRLDIKTLLTLHEIGNIPSCKSASMYRNKRYNSFNNYRKESNKKERHLQFPSFAFKMNHTLSKKNVGIVLQFK